MAKANGKAATVESFEKLTAAPNEMMQKGLDRAMSFAGEFGDIGRGNVAAMTESAKAARKGMEALNTRAMEYMKDAVETGAAATKSVTSAKSLQEAIELQSNFAKAAFEKYVAELNAMTSLMSATMRDAAEPLNAQAGAVVEKLQTAG
ncbi:MAG: phasin family protein [Pseudomonadota bacterium]